MTAHLIVTPCPRWVRLLPTVPDVVVAVLLARAVRRRRRGRG